MKKYFFPAVFAVILLLSCASNPAQGNAGKKTNLLPLSAGWYQYDFERTIKSIEVEYQFALSTGMKMVQEMTWKYTGIVSRFEDDALFDPIAGIELLIDSDGSISCAENVSIRGTVNKNGSFFWSGLHEEHGSLNSLFVKGTLTPLPSSVRGGREFDGVYHMTDNGTGKQQLVKISDGFYTWNYIDNNEETVFTPWPTLIKPDGTFSFSLDITTVMEMGGLSSMNFSNSILSEGKVTPGQGISMEETARTSGLGVDKNEHPQVFSGTAIRSGQFPNEAIPKDIENILKAGRSEARAAPKPVRANYPPWYLNLPAKTGFIYAAGEKTFADKNTALAMAEAAAAANLADQIKVRIETSMTEVSNNAGTTLEEKIKIEALQRMKYRVVEQTYNEKTNTAFVLLETAAE